MKNKIIATKANAGKGGRKGNQMWSAHRLEGVVKNVAIKPEKKKKKEKN